MGKCQYTGIFLPQRLRMNCIKSAWLPFFDIGGNAMVESCLLKWAPRLTISSDEKYREIMKTSDKRKASKSNASNFYQIE